MKAILAALVCLVAIPSWSATAAAGSELRSVALKKQICRGAAETVVEDNAQYSYWGDIDNDKCAAGQFQILASKSDATLGQVTWMKIGFVSELGPLSVQGEAVLALDIKVDRDGRATKKWLTRDVTFQSKDNRTTLEVIKNIIDDSGTMYVGNGDASYDVPAKKPTKKEAIDAVEAIMEDYGNESDGEYNYCRFTTQPDTARALEDLEHYAPELYAFLKRQLAAGNLEIMVSRVYESGASEYCSKYAFKVVTKDGIVIHLMFDETT